MHYEGTVIRPPSEADSIILQVTVGCSRNHCTFCGAYKDVRFRIKEEEIVSRDIDFAARHCRTQKRVFLADGDALIIPQSKLEHLFTKIRNRLDRVKRISLYASAGSIRQKSIADLKHLKKLGLDRVYLGVESGDDEVLLAVRKKETAASLESAGKKIIEAGLFLSTTIISGLAGPQGSTRHARLTAELLNRISPNQVAALTLIPMENTALGRDVLDKRFTLLSPVEILEELKLLVERLTVDRSQFAANHASNYLPVTGRLQRDKTRIIRELENALLGKSALVPEYSRRL